MYGENIGHELRKLCEEIRSIAEEINLKVKAEQFEAVKQKQLYGDVEIC